MPGIALTRRGPRRDSRFREPNERRRPRLRPDGIRRQSPLRGRLRCPTLSTTTLLVMVGAIVLAIAAYAVSGALAYAKEPGSAGPDVTRSTDAQNTPATGAPSASGTPRVGQVLTADTTGIADADGLTNASYGYQWLRVNGGSETSIPDATGVSYTLAAADVGNSIKVRVSFMDDLGSEEVLVSNATEEVTTSPIPVIWEGRVSVGQGMQGNKVWLGFTLFGGSLGSISLPRSVRVANSTYSVQLVLHTAADVYLGMSSELPESFVLQIDDAEFNSVDASGEQANEAYLYRWPNNALNWSEGDEVVLSLRTSAMATARPNSPATGAPATTGTARVGETLTVDTFGIRDGDGITNAMFTFQWLADDADIGGATNSDYTLTSSELGNAIKVRVSFTDDRGHRESLTSAATGAVAAQPNHAATGAPAISGMLQVGESLSVSTAGIADSDGLANVSFAYQWLSNDGTGDSTITGATGATYALVDADAGKAIKVRVSFTDNQGHQETLTSAATGTVVARPNRPATGAPAISGTVQVGAILSASTAGIADSDGLANVSFAYQWLTYDGIWDSTITGATGATYALVDADAGKAIKVRVSFTDNRGNLETLTSAATGAVAALPNRAATGAPAISGTAQVGATLSASTAGIADSDGLANVSFAYQWLSNDGTGDSSITGATSATYKLVDADAGKAIKVRVSFTDSQGHQETLTSAATGPWLLRRPR